MKRSTRWRRLAREEARWSGERAAVAGVDEAGRGPLAGPVVAAAVILDPSRDWDGIDDSKQLTAEQLVSELLRGIGVGSGRKLVIAMKHLIAASTHVPQLRYTGLISVPMPTGISVVNGWRNS